jgi:GMP reductase
MLIENEVYLDFDDVLLKPKRSTLASRKDVSLIRAYNFRHSKQTYSGVPIVAANMTTVGTFGAASVLEKNWMLTCLHKFLTIEDIINTTANVDYLVYSMGMTGQDLDKFKEVSKHKKFKYVCIDVANGYSEKFNRFVANFRENWIDGDVTLIAGNVATPEMTEQLILSGADIVKIGIGPGSVCTTRVKTGVGVPQLSAVIECADAAHGLGGHIIADGGCKIPADIAKAFCAGADFVMLGGMFAGHKENTDPSQIDMGKVLVYGMSSNHAQEEHFNGKKEHRASEGRLVEIPYKGELQDTINEILASLRSTCTYIGAERLKDMSKCATFIRVNNTHNRVYEHATIGD